MPIMTFSLVANFGDHPLVAKSNATPMPTAYQTLGQSLKQLPHAEDTPAAKIIFVVEVNAITMPTDYQTLDQFLQEIPPVEDIAADEAPAADNTPPVNPLAINPC